MRFGIYAETQCPPEKPHYDLTWEIVRQMIHADAVGFDSYSVIEHHFFPQFGISANPLAMLVAAAQHTQRLRFGDRRSHLVRRLRQRGEQSLVHADLRHGARGRSDRDPAFDLAASHARLDELAEHRFRGAQLVGQPELNVQKTAVDAFQLRRERGDRQVSGRRRVSGHAADHRLRFMRP